jgi:hypothetical protein
MTDRVSEYRETMNEANRLVWGSDKPKSADEIENDRKQVAELVEKAKKLAKKMTPDQRREVGLDVEGLFAASKPDAVRNQHVRRYGAAKSKVATPAVFVAGMVIGSLLSDLKNEARPDVKPKKSFVEMTQNDKPTEREGP